LCADLRQQLVENKQRVPDGFEDSGGGYERLPTARY
jgi:hypothetical protein